MKLKSKLLISLIIVCVTFAVTGVSAENVTDDSLQLDMDSNHDLKSVQDDGGNQDNLATGDHYKSFNDFYNDVGNCNGTLNLEDNYKYGESDNPLFITKQNLVINGNGHIIDGNGYDYGITFDNQDGGDTEGRRNVVINDLTLMNFNETVFTIGHGKLTINNVTFINCHGSVNSLISVRPGDEFVLNNSKLDSFKYDCELIMSSYGNISIYNSHFNGKNCSGQFLIGDRGQLAIENSTFENFQANIGAIIDFKGDYLSIRNSRFLNSHAKFDGGAIIAKYFPLYDEDTQKYLPTADMLIENCTFSNLSAANDGGAIYIDMDSGSWGIVKTLNIVNSNFTDCTSRFGGAFAVQGGNLNIWASNFINNTANFEGGAIYATWCNVTVVNSNLVNNTALKNAGALYFDKGRLTIRQSNLTQNKAIRESETTANCIYAHDVDAYFSDSIFDNGGISVYADFASDSKLENITKNEDIFLMDNKNYIVSIESNGIKLNLTKKFINVTDFPSKYDMRDFGWVSPVKIQGDNDDCWAFATVASLESSLLKTTGALYNLSANYVQALQLKYAHEGDIRISMTGFAYSGLGYALNWIGALPMDGAYDSRGMILDTDLDDARIHVQDAMIIFGGTDDTEDLIKEAIMKYGAVAVQMILSDPKPVNWTGEAVADHGIHFVSIIGWDDEYVDNSSDDSNENLSGEEGDDEPIDQMVGAWLVKDSISGFRYVFYEDKSLLGIDYYAIVPQNAGICYIFENDMDYHVNYQTDLVGLTGFDENYTYYSNKFTSKYDEWIGAVGTYFNESGIDYSFDVYVNGVLNYTQSGVSEFAGFRTIVMKRYIPIKAGDEFEVRFKSNALPYQDFSRQHYMPGMTFISSDGESWSDFTLQNKTVCLKVYTTREDRKYYTFEELQQSIDASTGVLNLEHDYMYDCTPIVIEKDGGFTINGNGHVIEGINVTDAFTLGGNETIVLNNMTFKNCIGAKLYTSANIIFNNVEFVNCSGAENDYIINSMKHDVEFNNCTFHNLAPGRYDVIGVDGATTIVKDSRFYECDFNGSIISVNRGSLAVENNVFENITSRAGTAINYKGFNLTVKNSKFINLHARLSAGAIIGKFFPLFDNENGYVPFGPFLIEDCEFINTSSIKDGGALYFDLNSGSEHQIQTVSVVNATFNDCRSKYGGAIAHQGGVLSIANSTIKNSYASFEGGAIYTSWADLNLANVVLSNNSAEKNAGAIYFDKGKLRIMLSNLTNNRVIKGSSSAPNAIFAYDVDAYFADSIFDNGGISVYADFASDSKLENVTKNDDIFLMDNKNYVVSVESNGMKLKLVQNELIVEKLPPKFDLRDWAWVTPGKLQGDNDDCWAFATIASIESSLLRATGISYNLSQNYVQNLQLKYARNGDLRISLTGFSYSGLGYALSWYGVLPMDGPYDDRGMLADTDLADARIHVQDAMFIFPGANNTNDLIKHALLKYGPVTVQVILASGEGEKFNDTGEDIALMDHGIHFVSIIGWDDEEGCWLTKDSLSKFSREYYNREELMAIDYYAIVTQNVGICYIFENDIDYHVNYQTDLTALTGFDGNYTYYSNEFTSKYDELIGAVGTYFNEAGINYSFDVYVNGAKVHSQSGVSEFAGFRTIILNKYIPIKKGDKFKVVFKNNALPYQAYSRQHYVQGMSFVSADGKSWSDITLQNKTVCLKVYTVKDDTRIVDNKNIAVDYSGGSYFSVRVVTADGHAVGAGEVVKFTINGKTYAVKTDNDGIAKIKITQLPKKYTITTTYNGKSYKNTVTVKQVLTASKVTIKKKTAKKLVLKAKLKINGKLVKGKKITFKFKGKKYTVKTNKNGIAKKTLKKKVIKKLKKGKKYKVKVTYLKTTIKTTVKVK